MTVGLFEVDMGVVFRDPVVMKRIFAAVALSAAILYPSVVHAQIADSVIVNARIWSSDGSSGPDKPDLGAFGAIKDGRFIFIGERNDRFIGDDTVVIDAEGRVVIPGLIDSHIHMLGGGRSLSAIQLRNATSKEDFIRRVAAWVDTLQDGDWILGGRYSTESWTSREQPTKDWLDLVTTDHPAWLSRMDGHSGLANSKALALAGITKDGPADPEGGVIDRDANTNEPTGILRESAMRLVTRHIPGNTDASSLQALQRAMGHANANGITSVVDIPGGGSLDLYETIAAGEEQTCRLYLYPTIGNLAAALPAIEAFEGRSHWVQVNGFKAYMDGSLGSRTAYMRAPFLNNEPTRQGWRGLLADGVADGTFIDNTYAARDAGLQTIAHAIGDQANHYLIETLDAVYWDSLKGARCRSEHAQHLLPDDIERFAELGIIASLQPYHKADDGRYAEEYIGHERCKSSYAYRSLLDAGATICFGSDWPVVTINPFLGIEAAVAGRTLDGKDWHTQENISVAEALSAYTSDAAYAMFAEDEVGKIAKGYRADFVILNQDPFANDPNWSTMAPVATYVEGELVYER